MSEIPKHLSHSAKFTISHNGKDYEVTYAVHGDALTVGCAGSYTSTQLDGAAQSDEAVKALASMVARNELISA
jgi:hypothetical protein